jgi:Soluble NSF attachment protein, SNAP
MSDVDNSPQADDGVKSSGKGSSGPSSAQALNSPHAKQAKELVDKAEKTLKSWLYLKGNKTEDALELYQQAANKYKMAKCYHEAGETFTRMAPCHLKLDSKYEAANAYVDASNCYRKSSIEGLL